MTVAGDVGAGSSDGTNSDARFDYPQGITVDSFNNLYVADTFNYTIRRLVSMGPNWVSSTLAGSPGLLASIDGTNSEARFKRPFGIVKDNASNLYTSDSAGHTIRQITADGSNWVVTTIAGSAGLSGSVDGTNGAARFNTPEGLAIDGAGNIYVADTANSLVRKLVRQGTDWIVTTLAGSAGLTGSSDGTGTNALFNHPEGLAADSTGNVYVADTQNDTFRKITSDGVVTTIAGVPGQSGSANGLGTVARFNYPAGISFHSSGTIFIADTGNYTIRSIAPSGTNWIVTTLAGTVGSPGTADGTNQAAQFTLPYCISVDAGTNVYVADSYNHTIRKVVPVGNNWVVSTVAGVSSLGSTDGTNSSVRFYQPEGIASDNAGTFFLSDTVNGTIRMMLHQGSNWIVTTIAGKANRTTGRVDGTNAAAHFFRPQGLALDSTGNIYVADTGNNAVRRVTPIGTNWVTKTLGTGFNEPTAVVLDTNGNIYVAEFFNQTIRRMVPSGPNWVVSTIAGLSGNSGSADGTNTAARFQSPHGVTLDNAGNVYVADYGNYAIRQIVPAGTNWVVTTIAGNPGTPGAIDGTNNQARFRGPYHIVADGVGSLYVSDSIRIRKITHAGTNWVVTTLKGPGSAFSNSDGLVVDNAANLCVVDMTRNVIRFGEPMFKLGIGSFTENIVLSWPLSASNYLLESTAMGDPPNWLTLSNGIFLSGDSFVWSNAAPAGSAFYRLRKQ